MKPLTKILTAAILVIPSCASAQSTTLYQIEQSPFATYIAQKVGDILTVVVNENAKTSDDGDAAIKKKDNISATLKKFFFPGFKISKGFDDVMGDGDEPGMELSSKTDFQASAENSSEHKFTTQLQVRIIEKVREGEFVIRGQRLININGKDKTIFISGVIRQRDIAADNTIQSHKIADASIEIDGAFFHKEVRPSIFTRLFNYIF